MPENIDAFNAIAADVLATLYAAFPEGTDFKVEFLTGENGDQRAAPRLLGTLQFLQREGFIHIPEHKGHPVPYVVFVRGAALTAKGLAALDTPLPDLLDNQADTRTVGERLREASVSGSKEMLKAVIGQVVQFGATAVMNWHP